MHEVGVDRCVWVGKKRDKERVILPAFQWFKTQGGMDNVRCGEINVYIVVCGVGPLVAYSGVISWHLQIPWTNIVVERSWLDYVRGSFRSTKTPKNEQGRWRWRMQGEASWHTVIKNDRWRYISKNEKNAPRSLIDEEHRSCREWEVRTKNNSSKQQQTAVTEATTNRRRSKNSCTREPTASLWSLWLANLHPSGNTREHLICIISVQITVGLFLWNSIPKVGVSTKASKQAE